MIASASEHNWPLLKKLGADETVSYRDADFVDKVKKLAGGGVDCVFDCYTARRRFAGPLTVAGEWRDPAVGPNAQAGRTRDVHPAVRSQVPGRARGADRGA